jgi:hypothetical protein
VSKVKRLDIVQEECLFLIHSKIKNIIIIIIKTMTSLISAQKIPWDQLPSSFSPYPRNNIKITFSQLKEMVFDKIPELKEWEYLDQTTLVTVGDFPYKEYAKIPMMFFQPLSGPRPSDKLLGYDYYFEQKMTGHHSSFLDTEKYKPRTRMLLRNPIYAPHYTGESWLFDPAIIFGHEMLAAYAARSDIPPGKYIEECELPNGNKISCVVTYRALSGGPRARGTVVRDEDFKVYLKGPGDSPYKFVMYAQYIMGVLKMQHSQLSSEDIFYHAQYNPDTGYRTNSVLYASAESLREEEGRDIKLVEQKGPIITSLIISRAPYESSSENEEISIGYKALNLSQTFKNGIYTLVYSSDPKAVYLYDRDHIIREESDTMPNIFFRLFFFVTEDDGTMVLTYYSQSGDRLNGPKYSISYKPPDNWGFQQSLHTGRHSISFYIEGNEVSEIEYRQWRATMIKPLTDAFPPELTQIILDYTLFPEDLCYWYVNRFRKKGPFDTSI